LRAAYDASYAARNSEPISLFELKEFAAGVDGEANRRMGILCLLYNAGAVILKPRPFAAGVRIDDVAPT